MAKIRKKVSERKMRGKITNGRNGRNRGGKEAGRRAAAWVLALVMGVTAIGGSLPSAVKAAEYRGVSVQETEWEGQTEAGTGMTPGGEAETGSETDPEAETETGTEMESGEETETGSEDEAGEETEAGSESGTGEETETGSESGTGEGTETGSESEAEGETETGNEGEAGEETGSEGETGEEVETESESEAEGETESESETEEETEELWKLKSIEGLTLSSDELDEKQKLKSTLTEMTDLREGVDYVADELVFLTETAEEAQAIADAYGSVLKEFAEGVGVMTLPEGIGVEKALRSVAEAKDIVIPAVWPNYIYTAYAADPLLNMSGGNYQWQHLMLGTSYAWAQGYTGADVKIAVLDSGISSHEELEVLSNHNFIDGEGTEDMTSDSHGTCVAGLIAAKKDNGEGGAGIAPEAELINIKVLDKQKKSDSVKVVRGIQKAMDAGADIINISFGGSAYDGNCEGIVKQAYEQGILVLAAAGNDSSRTMCYPACYEGAFAIGAVQKNKEKSFHSNYGSWIKYSAPGENLWSTAKDGMYVTITGTSAATAVMSGAAAVVLSGDKAIREKTGRDRVMALIKKMDGGKIAGNSGASGIVYLPKVLGITVSTANPGVPVFSENSKSFQEESVLLEIYPKSALDTIYYSLDGKNPTYKNGILSQNAREYTGAIQIGNQAKVVVKAIAIDTNGKVSKVASATYNFKPLVTGISISGSNKLVRGGSMVLKAAVTPAFAGNRGITWTSSDQTAVKVDQKGKVTVTNRAEEGKNYVITATAKDGSGVRKTFWISVTAEPQIDKIVFEKKNDTVTRGDKDVIYRMNSILQVERTDGTAGTAADVSYSSSNTKVAVVNDDYGSSAKGQVRVLAPGKTVITATANDGSKKKATFTLNVKQSVTQISIEGLSEICKGKTVQMTAVTKPDNAGVKGVVWSVAPENKGVTVDKNGKVKVTKEATTGNYTITAAAKDGSEVYAEKNIKLIEKEITKITLSNKSVKIFRTNGNYASNLDDTLNSTIIYAAAKAKTTSGISTSSTAYEFTSSNPGVAVVEQKGNAATVTATGRVTGSTKITCKALDGSGKTAACTVTVINLPSSISVVPAAGSNGFVGVGKKLKLNVVIGQEYGKVSSRSVVWTSSDESVATVDKNGNVKGIKAGSAAVITARLKDNSRIFATYTVGIREAIKSLGLNNYPAKGTLNIAVNETAEGKVLYNGETYSSADSTIYPGVTVENSKPDCLAVESNGFGKIKLRGKKKGTVTITIKAVDGSGVKKSYKIQVK